MRYLLTAQLPGFSARVATDDWSATLDRILACATPIDVAVFDGERLETYLGPREIHKRLAMHWPSTELSELTRNER